MVQKKTLCFEDNFIYLKGRVTQRDREISFIDLFTPQMATSVRAGPDWSQDLGASFQD